MSIIGMILMWLFLATVFAIGSQWAEGKENKRRQAYWEKYES